MIFKLNSCFKQSLLGSNIAPANLDRATAENTNGQGLKLSDIGQLPDDLQTLMNLLKNQVGKFDSNTVSSEIDCRF